MNEALMRKIALRAVDLVNKQIDAGIDETGKKYAYSTRGVAVPWNKRIYRPKRVEEGEISVFKRNGKRWIYVRGGYRQIRQWLNRDPDGDFLQMTGKMLNSMSGRATGTNSAAVYFTDAEMAMRAYYFTKSGVGATRKLWRFLGLTPANAAALEEYAAKIAAEQGIDFSDYVFE